jgi:hypothetical protein
MTTRVVRTDQQWVVSRRSRLDLLRNHSPVAFSACPDFLRCGRYLHIGRADARERIVHRVHHPDRAPTVPDSPRLAPDYAPAPSRLHLLASAFLQIGSNHRYGSFPGFVVFGWFRKREKPRVFLGMIVIVPRTGIKPHFDQFGVFGNEELETSLRASLHEIFPLPPASGGSLLYPRILGWTFSFRHFRQAAFGLSHLGIAAFQSSFHSFGGPRSLSPAVSITCSPKKQSVHSPSRKKCVGASFSAASSRYGRFSIIVRPLTPRT